MNYLSDKFDCGTVRMSGWDCTICTFYNKNSAFKCKMCGASRGTSTRQARYVILTIMKNFTVSLLIRLPDQPLMQLEPPAKKAKFSKSRIATTGKSVAKQSKTVSHSLQSAAAGSNSSDNIQIDSIAGSSSDLSQKHNNEVEKVIVEQPVYNGEIIRNGQYVPQWDPYVMVETVSNVRLFSNNMLDSEAYMTPHLTDSGVTSLRMSNVTLLPTVYENKHTKGESSQQSVKAKGYSKRGTIPYPHSGKEKGPQKAKTWTNRGKRSYQKNKDGQLLLSDVSSNPSADDKVVSKQTKSFSKMMTSGHHGESSRQQQQYGESSRPHCSHRTWPTIPNLDYASGKRLQVTFNDETVFITQYKLLK